MNGTEFYELLRNNYIENGQTLYDNFTFCDWLYKPRNGTFSFRFNIINNNPKAIPCLIWVVHKSVNMIKLKIKKVNKKSLFLCVG